MKQTTSLATLALAILLTASFGGTSFARGKAAKQTTCIVTDNDLDSMGDKQSFVHKGKKIQVCCEPCIGKFKKNPEKYLKKI